MASQSFFSTALSSLLMFREVAAMASCRPFSVSRGISSFSASHSLLAHSSRGGNSSFRNCSSSSFMVTSGFSRSQPTRRREYRIQETEYRIR